MSTYKNVNLTRHPLCVCLILGRGLEQKSRDEYLWGQERVIKRRVDRGSEGEKETPTDEREEES